MERGELLSALWDQLVSLTEVRSRLEGEARLAWVQRQLQAQLEQREGLAADVQVGHRQAEGGGRW